MLAVVRGNVSKVMQKTCTVFPFDGIIKLQKNKECWVLNISNNTEYIAITELNDQTKHVSLMSNVKNLVK